MATHTLQWRDSTVSWGLPLSFTLGPHFYILSGSPLPLQWCTLFVSLQISLFSLHSHTHFLLNSKNEKYVFRGSQPHSSPPFLSSHLHLLCRILSSLCGNSTDLDKLYNYCVLTVLKCENPITRSLSNPDVVGQKEMHQLSMSSCPPNHVLLWQEPNGCQTTEGFTPPRRFILFCWSYILSLHPPQPMSVFIQEPHLPAERLSYRNIQVRQVTWVKMRKI